MISYCPRECLVSLGSSHHLHFLTAFLRSMCNAANHPSGCNCGFGGDTGGGGWHWGRVSNFVENYAPPSFGWARDHGGTVESYVNPNAHCPVCGCPLYFYRSPYNGRVFFDDLGWPWPKHACTDNRREPQRATTTSTVRRSEQDVAWRREGWSPLLSPRISHGVERSGVRGDCESGFVDLVLPRGTKIDRETPVLIRQVFPDLHQATFLASDHFSTRPVVTIAFDRRLTFLEDEVLALAAKRDATALYSVARFLLWNLNDPEGARPYLEGAVARGNVEAAIDLLTLALFPTSDQP